MELTDIREIAAHQNEVGKTQIEERLFIDFRRLEVAICDIKLGRNKKKTLCFY